MEKYSKVPFSVIVASSDGNEKEIQKVLKHYDGYISKLSLRPLYDEYGNVYMVVDTDLKGRIQSALIRMVLNFEIAIV